MSSASSSDETTIQMKLVQMILNLLVENRKKKQRGTTVMSQLEKVHKSGVKYSIEFNAVYTILDGPHTLFFKSYVAFLGRNKVNILIND